MKDDHNVHNLKVKRIDVRAFLFLVLLAGACSTQQVERTDTRLHIKRSSIWVPDLDQAVVFFRDVIGLEIDTIGTLDLEPDSVLFELFNADPTLKIRRALFSSELESRALFVMASKGAPSYAQDEKRSAILVIRAEDLDAVIARAKSNDFAVGKTNVGTSQTTGRTTRETVIFGPGGNAFLVYQTSEPD